MKNVSAWLTCCLVLGAPLVATASEQGATRIDFEGELVQGQTNQGAVHMIERKDSDLGTLVKERVHFRERIVGQYGLVAEAGLSTPARAELRQKKARQAAPAPAAEEDGAGGLGLSTSVPPSKLVAPGAPKAPDRTVKDPAGSRSKKLRSKDGKPNGAAPAQPATPEKKN